MWYVGDYGLQHHNRKSFLSRRFLGQQELPSIIHQQHKAPKQSSRWVKFCCRYFVEVRWVFQVTIKKSLVPLLSQCNHHSVQCRCTHIHLGSVSGKSLSDPQVIPDKMKMHCVFFYMCVEEEKYFHISLLDNSSSSSHLLSYTILTALLTFPTFSASPCLRLWHLFKE